MYTDSCEIHTAVICHVVVMLDKLSNKGLMLQEKLSVFIFE